MNIIKKIQLSILKFYILGYDEKKCSPHEVLTFFNTTSNEQLCMTYWTFFLKYNVASVNQSSCTFQSIAAPLFLDLTLEYFGMRKGLCSIQ